MTDVAVGIAAATVIAGGLVAGVAALVALHLLPTGLSPIRDAVSRYGIGRFRAGYRVQTLGYAVAGLGAAAAIAATPGAAAMPVALCLVFAVTRAAISWSPMDAPGGPSTPTGRRHGLLAIGAFGSVAFAAAAWSRSLGRSHALAPAGAVSGALAALMLASLVVLVADRRRGGRHFGLLERLFYAAMTAWLVVPAVAAVAAGR